MFLSYLILSCLILSILSYLYLIFILFFIIYLSIDLSIWSIYLSISFSIYSSIYSKWRLMGFINQLTDLGKTPPWRHPVRYGGFLSHRCAHLDSAMLWTSALPRRCQVGWGKTNIWARARAPSCDFSICLGGCFNPMKCHDSIAHKFKVDWMLLELCSPTQVAIVWGARLGNWKTMSELQCYWV